MARLTHEQQQRIMAKYGCTRLWSWSKINTFMTSQYEYFLSYVKHIPTDRNDCAYTVLGTLAHETIEGYYEGTVTYDEMIDNFRDGWLTAVDIADLKLDRNDDEKDVKLKRRYKENLELFFQHHTPYEHNLKIEMPITAKIGNSVFVGYIDAMYKDDDGNYTILDFKTSSKYVGKALEEHAGQLTIYAIGLNQRGVPMEKIRAGFNFLKYATVRYKQKNGAVKEKIVERSKLAEGIETNCRIWLREFGYGDDADTYIKQLYDANDVKCLPKSVADMYSVEDCHVYISLTQKDIDKWTNLIDNTIKEIEWCEREYEETGSEEAFWDTRDRIEEQSYYFATLCAYSRKLHKPWDMYCEQLEEKKNGLNLPGMNIGNVSTKTVKNKNDDMAWLDELMF